MLKRKFLSFIFLLSLLLTFSFSAFSEDSITITTYYPSPYGSYNELYVANKMGIGIQSPGTYDGKVVKLDVEGYAAANDLWLKDINRWTSDLAFGGITVRKVPYDCKLSGGVYTRVKDGQERCCNDGEVVIGVMANVTGERNYNVLSFSQGGKCFTGREGNSTAQELLDLWITCLKTQ